MMSKGSTTKCPEEIGGRVIFFKISIGSVWAIGLWVGLQLIRPELYLDDLLIIIIMDVWFDSIFGTLIVILLLKPQVKLASGLLALSRLLRLLTGLLLISYGAKSIYAFSIARLFSTLLAFVVTWVIAKPVFKVEGGVSPLRIFRESKAFNSGELLNQYFQYLDVNLLSVLGVNRALIANYSIVVGLIMAVSTLPSGMCNVFLTKLVRIYQINAEQFFKYIRIIVIGCTLLGILLLAIGGILSRPMITMIMGEDYRLSGQILFFLSPLFLIRAINEANITYLISVNMQDKRLIPLILAGFIKTLAGVWVVNKWQINGMVSVAIIAEIILFAGYIFQIAKHYKKTRLFWQAPI